MEYTKTFKQALKQAENRQKFLADTPYRKAVPFSRDVPQDVEPLKEREAFFIMSDAGVDREGDRILSAGVEVEQFRQFGSILWGHRSDEPRFVLGAPAEVIKEETRLLVKAEFLKEDANPDAERVLRMIKAGGVRAMSVGILIHEYTEGDSTRGYMPLDIVKSELIETSVTPVPVNPRAVLLAAGEDPQEQQAVVTLFEEAVEVPAQLAASMDATGLSEDAVKDLVHKTIQEMFGFRTYSVPSVDSNSADDALTTLARLLAQ